VDVTLVIRPYVEATDRAFVFDSWSKRQYYLLKAPRPPRRPFMAEIGKSIQACPEIRVAAMADDLEQIIGYAAFLHQQPVFVYVKRGYRGVGIEEALCQRKK
jgi:hypothetical protein